MDSDYDRGVPQRISAEFTVPHPYDERRRKWTSQKGDSDATERRGFVVSPLDERRTREGRVLHDVVHKGVQWSTSAENAELHTSDRRWNVLIAHSFQTKLGRLQLFVTSTSCEYEWTDGNRSKVVHL